MSIWEADLWQWLTLLQHELLLFAAVFFLIGALDDIAVDAVWLWLRAKGRVQTLRRSRTELQHRPLHAPAAVLIPAWREAPVIGGTITHLLASWPQPTLRLYVGCYRNDPDTLAAGVAAVRGDPRLRLVVVNAGIMEQTHHDAGISRPRDGGCHRLWFISLAREGGAFRPKLASGL